MQMTSELYCCLWRFLGTANTDQGCCSALRICNGLFTFQGGMSRVKRIILCLYLTWPKINSNFDLSNSYTIENYSSEIMVISKCSSHSFHFSVSWFVHGMQCSLKSFRTEQIYAAGLWDWKHKTSKASSQAKAVKSFQMRCLLSEGGCGIQHSSLLFWLKLDFNLAPALVGVRE